LPPTGFYHLYRQLKAVKRETLDQIKLGQHRLIAKS
jgi:hypothetical protein